MYELIAVVGGMISLWAIVAWLACGAFAGHVAGEKNRCGFCWFIWGLLFGPLGLIAAVGLPDNRRAEAVRSVDDTARMQSTQSRYNKTFMMKTKTPEFWIAVGILAIILISAYFKRII